MKVFLPHPTPLLQLPPRALVYVVLEDGLLGHGSLPCSLISGGIAQPGEFVTLGSPKNALESQVPGSGRANIDVTDVNVEDTSASLYPPNRNTLGVIFNSDASGDAPPIWESLPTSEPSAAPRLQIQDYEIEGGWTQFAGQTFYQSGGSIDDIGEHDENHTFAREQSDDLDSETAPLPETTTPPPRPAPQLPAFLPPVEDTFRRTLDDSAEEPPAEFIAPAEEYDVTHEILMSIDAAFIDISVMTWVSDFFFNSYFASHISLGTVLRNASLRCPRSSRCLPRCR